MLHKNKIAQQDVAHLKIKNIVQFEKEKYKRSEIEAKRNSDIARNHTDI